MDFIHETNRVYMKGNKEQVVAEVTFPSISDHLVNIDRTYVDPSLRGQGVAGKLMEETVTWLKKENKQAEITCSYAKGWFSEHPEASEVIRVKAL